MMMMINIPERNDDVESCQNAITEKEREREECKMNCDMKLMWNSCRHEDKGLGDRE